ncbi:hypothetical protein FLO80_17255 [Aquicoccus porphyridii]|uniref:Uncharacterized protein n=1 Tax=Aquicoccus porphyridii TaxID=1852029 RepID=A0A5A9Z4P5_9RHOB|nr:hypothetical protein [Aquicoccus porphyridii]KAA0912151.1 hypothetical protein FLO80_17255 [Aquicoccus porphyridii]RAI52996.1 hypothetical protein DOO74_13960 [Rhodobacteraceae bacterium AsT-22]
MRFVGFVLITMLGSVFFGGVSAGAVVAIAEGDFRAIVIVPANFLFGSIFLIPFYFLVWFIPSAFAFYGVSRLLRNSYPPAVRVRLAGFATAVLAALFFVEVTNGQQGIAEAARFVAVAAVAIAPFTAWRAYRSAFSTTNTSLMN